MDSPPPPAVLLRRYLESIPDFEAVAAALHPDVEFTLFSPTGRTNRGRDRIVRGLRREFENFYRADAFRLDVLMTFGDDTHAGARMRITADTALGHYENDYCVIARFADGLLVEAWEYLDTANAGNQLAAPSEG